MDSTCWSTWRIGASPWWPTNALVVGEPETTRTELLSKDAILGLEIVNHVALQLVGPAGEGHEEEPQRVGNWNHCVEPVKAVPRLYSAVTLNGLGADPVAPSNFRILRDSLRGVPRDEIGAMMHQPLARVRVDRRRHEPNAWLGACWLATMALAINICPTLYAATPWVLVWNDEFTGTANSPVNTREWLYDVGTQYQGGPAQWGTGEVEQMSSSIGNVSLDGNGHLAITPLHLGSVPTAGWTSGRIETMHVFEAPAGGALAIEASLMQPCEWLVGRRILAGVLGARFGISWELPKLAERWRTRLHGGRERPERGVRHIALRCCAGRTVQRIHRHFERSARVRRVPNRISRVPSRAGSVRDT
jgi:hypothetical protein